MSIPYTIRALEESDLKHIIDISNACLGLNFIKLKDLNEYLQVENKIALVAIVNQKIAGFALANICSYEEVIDLILSDKNWFKDQYSTANSIAMLKTIAVKAEYSNQGIGTALTEARIKIIKQKATSLFAVSWEHQQNMGNTKLLEKFGLTLKHRIKNYWSGESLEKGYSCLQCGAPPCKCSALIYCQ